MRNVGYLGTDYNKPHAARQEDGPFNTDAVCSFDLISTVALAAVNLMFQPPRNRLNGFRLQT